MTDTHRMKRPSDRRLWVSYLLKAASLCISYAHAEEQMFFRFSFIVIVDCAVTYFSRPGLTSQKWGLWVNICTTTFFWNQPWILVSLSDAPHLQCLLCSPGVHTPHSWCLLSDSEEARTYHMPGKESKSTIIIRCHIWCVHPPPQKHQPVVKKLLLLTIIKEAKHIHWVDYIVLGVFFFCLFFFWWSYKNVKWCNVSLFWALVTKSLQPFYVGITASCHTDSIYSLTVPPCDGCFLHTGFEEFFMSEEVKRKSGSEEWVSRCHQC